MAKKQFKYIYGPVASWRLGSSLGIDLLSGKTKYCSFNCTYCQLGPAQITSTRRRVFVSTQKIIAEIKKLPKVHIDYITFSGRGEPTLAKNLGQAIIAVKKIRPEPVAVLTNSTLLSNPLVRKELKLADLVAVKLDAPSAGLLQLLNRPARTVRFGAILKGVRQFRKEYPGRFILQIMLTPENKAAAAGLAKLAQALKPDQVQLNTPTRPSQASLLQREEICKIKKFFSGLNVCSVYEAKPKKISPLSRKATIQRRGKSI